jgi:hypothetical protein
MENDFRPIARRYAVRVSLDSVADGDLIGMVLEWLKIAGFVVEISADSFRDERRGRTSYATPVHRQLFVIRCAVSCSLESSRRWAENLARHINSFRDATAQVFVNEERQN